MTNDPWKETVRKIFDMLHFGTESVFDNEAARKVVNLIETRHEDYFTAPRKDPEEND